MTTEATDLLTQTFLTAVQSAHHGSVAENFQRLMPRLIQAVDPRARDGGHPLLQLVAGMANRRDDHPKAATPAAWPSLVPGFTPEEAAAAPWGSDVERWLAVLVARGADPFEGWAQYSTEDKAPAPCAFRTAFREGLEAWCGHMLQLPHAPQGLSLADPFPNDPARSSDAPLLHQAALANRPALATALLQAQFPVDHRDAEGCTALMRATGPATARVLLVAGADIFAQDPHGNTPADHWGMRTPEERDALMGVLDDLSLSPDQKHALLIRTQQRALLECAMKPDSVELRALLAKGVSDPRAVAWACAGILSQGPGGKPNLNGLLVLARAHPDWLVQRADLVWMTLGLMHVTPSERTRQQRLAISAVLPTPHPTPPTVFGRWAEDLKEIDPFPWRLALAWAQRLKVSADPSPEVINEWGPRPGKAAAADLVDFVNTTGALLEELADDLGDQVWDSLQHIPAQANAVHALSAMGAQILALGILNNLRRDPDMKDGHWASWFGVVMEFAEHTPGFLELPLMKDTMAALVVGQQDSHSQATQWALDTLALRARIAIPESPAPRRAPRL